MKITYNEDDHIGAVPNVESDLFPTNKLFVDADGDVAVKLDESVGYPDGAIIYFCQDGGIVLHLDSDDFKDTEFCGWLTKPLKLEND